MKYRAGQLLHGLQMRSIERRGTEVILRVGKLLAVGG